ncbi:MAG: ABC transporter permease [Hydrogenophaga sp.]|uniref:ABC transporter permease n=1 Tax=Hydrogenophaga sp. TaxID=1904254 RepID=UPI001BC1CF63|nr:FtsX-like permease family protein [Hydrogenophaga sp.]MBS3912527.1 ABC transporter permease [Hydrogenophaga sp.]MDO9147449.1 ABC transporter permease [Hydrogenophaga sp.]MDO9605785.1 ABC transporter permease [Hydrogenophaga sp.]MDP2163157.1 ABC transporter permease [Hydrogenophaga sp.]MDP3476224.1 ABC transporter permease [Hydrogenophaga sp.]
MTVFTLSWRYLWSRPLATALNLLLLALGLASVAFVLIARDQVERAFERDLAGIDLVVGAKGSPMQLILAGVFHLDVPPGNIALADVQALEQHPQVAQLIPLSLGDNLQGFRIVGTTVAYPQHYAAKLQQGAWWAAPMEAVLGAQVARATGLVLGQAFFGAHGLGQGGMAHDEALYRVTGVLAPCGCVLDRLVLTATESVWKVHDDMHATDDMTDEDREAIAADREVTVALIRYNSPLAAVSLPRFINDSTALQAAAPAVEITRLLSMVGVGTRVFQGLGVVLLGVAALSVFIALWSAVRERRGDLAMLRMLGASPLKVGALLLCEALWLAVMACVLGLLTAHGLAALLAELLMAEQSLALSGWQWVHTVVWVPVLALGVALLAAGLPALSAYRLDVMPLLNSR